MAKGTLYVLAVITVIIGVATAIAMAYRQREGNTASSNCQTECLKAWPDYSLNCRRCCVDTHTEAPRPRYDQGAKDCMQTNSDYENDKFHERLARLAAGVAVVKGGRL